MKKIVYLPLDERPCNYDFPALLAQDTPYSVVRPPKSLMPARKRAGDIAGLTDFLRREMRTAHGAVLSLNTFLYGGLLPSRLHRQTAEELLDRLDVLRQLKAEFPETRLYAFTLIMRCNRANQNGEEPDYYNIWGSRIYRRGYLTDKSAEAGLGAEEEAELAALQTELPADIMEDYLGRRAVNHRVNLEILQLQREGIFEFLAIPQDDASEYGYTAAEQREIRARISALRIGMKCFLYPGADEAGCTLLARVVNDDLGRRPRVYIRYGSAAAPLVQPLYEDRYLGESVKYMVLAAGGLPVYAQSDCDLVLLVNCPADHMEYSITAGRNYSVNRTLPELAEYAAYCVENGWTVTIGDCATVNAGDPELLSLLSQKGLLMALGGYAGWNTSDNTLGTAVCMGMLHFHFGGRRGHREFLVLRYLEDVGYYAGVRDQLIAEKAPFVSDEWPSVPETGEAADFVKERLRAFLEDLQADFPAQYTIQSCSFPWERVFEIALTVRETGQ